MDLCEAQGFGYSQLVWSDGRWVQDPETYSLWRGWFTVTSDSSFMRSGCRPQSELRGRLMGLAPTYVLATLCQPHCTTCAAQGIKGPRWLGVILAFLPVIPGSSRWHLKHQVRVAQVSPFKGAPHGTCWRQPCSTCPTILVGSPIFLWGFSGISSPGKVPRLLSN